MKILLVNNEKDKTDLGSINALKNSVQQVAEADFVVKHYTGLSGEEVDELAVNFVILSGRHNSNWGIDEMYLFKSEYDIIRTCKVPLLGICAGFQLMGLAYGAALNYICPKRKDKCKEFGYQKVNLLGNDKIFSGLSSTLTVYQNHYCELKDVPDGFIKLAESDMTKIQCIKDTSRNVYGVQFHPELFNDKCNDGKVILKNFFSLT
ncbi:type 1 glutamine amidotransferase [Desulfitibacter alkalitolerans]|uniref:type 1 glutamine amidotransferase n=1 Tax=Desulfitibacter alkalitolerans TaxID=264641 RepID=UPI0004863386|nr:gamma-glutamyl-gamma-aminobutyrate hydrolase family protein [Desulfitibacter alkalitolerans]